MAVRPTDKKTVALSVERDDFDPEGAFAEREGREKNFHRVPIQISIRFYPILGPYKYL